MNQEDKFTQVLSHCKSPNLHAVVKLPRVDVLYTILCQVVSDVSDVQAELSDVQEAKLIAGHQVQAQNLSEAVLSDTDPILNLEATAANFTFLCEIVIHTLHCKFEERGVFLLIFIIGVGGCIED